MEQVGAPQQRSYSGFLHKLPRELRDEIYDHVFLSTRFCFGERATSRIGSVRVVSANRGIALSILRTCRQVRDEIGRKWLTQVHFIFESPQALLDKLTPLNISTLNQIKHVRVSGDTEMVSWGYDDVYYRTAQLLKLLPGLNLDRLTVMGAKHTSISLETLTKLVASSDGWKELRYLSHNSGLIGLAQSPWLYPGSFTTNSLYWGWQEVLDKRDGRDTAPSVTVYRSKSPSRGSVLDPGKRTVYPHDRLVNRRAEKDDALMRPSEREKEVLVVVKRGAGVAYAERDPATLLPEGDIREDSPAQTWAQIKSLSKEMSMLSDDESEDSDDDTADVLIDAYSHVDDYTWPPFHFIED